MDNPMKVIPSAAATLMTLALPTASASARQSIPELVLEPVRYELDVAIDYERATLQGTAQITVRNRAAVPQTELPLLLYRLLTVTTARDTQGGALSFIQGVRSVDGFPRLQVNGISITLPDSLPPNDTTTVAIGYEGYLLGYVETGMRYIQDRIDTAFTIIRDDAYAFPTIGVPSLAGLRGRTRWRFHYIARVTVPATLVVANGGRLLDRTERDGLATYTYVDRVPAWRLDLAIARYGILDAGGARVYYLPGDSAGAAMVARAVEGAWRLYTEWFGPLREERSYSVIEIPEGWGSQADRTAILQTAAAFRDPRRWLEVYHEVSHLWNVTELDAASPRWNEGLAMFLQYLTAERLEGRPVLGEQIAATIALLEERFASHAEERDAPLIRYGSVGLTNLSYQTGMVLFAALYELVGSEQFNRIVGGFYQRYAGSGATTDDFVRFAKTTATVDLTAFFNDWVYTSRWTDHLRRGVSIDKLIAPYRP